MKLQRNRLPTLALTLAVAAWSSQVAAAGYVWWKVMKAKKGKKAEAPATVGRTTGRDPTWVVAPVLTFDPAGANVLGGAASVEF